MTSKIEKLNKRQEPTSIILVEPEYFQVVDQKNPYMNAAIDFDLAMQQWEALLQIYNGLKAEGILSEVSVIPGVKDSEDMVFCANQSLPWMAKGGAKNVVLSNMRHASRRREVVHFEGFYRQRKYKVHHVDESLLLEGMGDCIFHPFHELLWMGHGYRTSEDMQPILAQRLNMPVMPLKLVSEYFYHLDTCFLPVNETKVLLCTEAFDQDSLQSIRDVFEEVVEVSREEAIETFCLNAHCIYNDTNPVAVMQKGDHSAKRELTASGYRVIETDTSEFIKSGGSVYCMKMMYY